MVEPGKGQTLAQDKISMKIKTLLVDDSIAFLNIACRYLATQPIELVGKAQSGAMALKMSETLKPDLVLLDLELGDAEDMNGMIVLHAIKAQPHPPCVIIITLHDQDEYREAARQAGANGFISKRDFATALAPLVHTLFNDDGAIDMSGITTN